MIKNIIHLLLPLFIGLILVKYEFIDTLYRGINTGALLSIIFSYVVDQLYPKDASFEQLIREVEIIHGKIEKDKEAKFPFIYQPLYCGLIHLIYLILIFVFAAIK